MSSLLMMSAHISMYYHFAMFRDSGRFVPLKGPKNGIYAVFRYLTCGVRPSIVSFFESDLTSRYKHSSNADDIGDNSIASGFSTGFSTNGNVPM